MLRLHLPCIDQTGYPGRSLASLVRTFWQNLFVHCGLAYISREIIETMDSLETPGTCLVPRLFTAMRLYPLLLPRELNIIVDHLQRVRTIPQKYEIPGRPKIFGEILLFKMWKVFENLCRGLLSNGPDANGWRRGWRHIEDPLNVIGMDGHIFEPPCK